MSKVMHNERARAQTPYIGAIANFIVCNFENDTNGSPHSFSLDVTVRTDRMSERKDIKMGEYLKEQYDKRDNERRFENLRKSVKQAYKKLKFYRPTLTLMQFQHLYAVDKGFRCWADLRQYYLGKGDE